jgi:hypothetical protein
MPYRKGELSPAEIDRRWPYQVAVPADVVRQRHAEVEATKIELGGAARPFAVSR